jgi:hypothetical protein
MSWSELLKIGAASPRDAVPPGPEDVSTIMYTSGTTGEWQSVFEFVLHCLNLDHGAYVMALMELCAQGGCAHIALNMPAQSYCYNLIKEQFKLNRPGDNNRGAAAAAATATAQPCSPCCVLPATYCCCACHHHQATPREWCTPTGVLLQLWRA